MSLGNFVTGLPVIIGSMLIGSGIGAAEKMETVIYLIAYCTQIMLFGLLIYMTIRVIWCAKKEDLECNKERVWPSVSIVIPFRNEELNLDRLLETLISQKYRGTYEIIVVNDGSTDKSELRVVQFKKLHKEAPIILVSSAFSATVNLTSKQQALDAGVKQASCECLVFTDADMNLPDNWLYSLASGYDASHQFIYGHTIIEKKSGSLFERFQAYQLEFLFAIAFGFACSRLPGSCMGNNILFSRKWYTGMGGQASIGYSIVEDRSLMTKAFTSGCNPTPVTPFYPNAQTAACTTVIGFFNQMLRWIRGGAAGSYSLLPAITLFALFNIFLGLSMCGVLDLSLFLTGLIDLIALCIFIKTTFIKIRSPKKCRYFLLYYGLFLLEMVIMLLPALLIAPEWKKRRV